MTSRTTLKAWKYALVYFTSTDEIGIIKASQVADGYKQEMKKGNYVAVNWDGELFQARVLDVGG